MELRVNKIVGLGGGARQTDLDCGFGLVGGDKRIKNLSGLGTVPGPGPGLGPSELWAWGWGTH